MVGLSFGFVCWSMVGLFCVLQGCEFNSCQNGGTCEPVGERGFHCICPADYIGTRCETGSFQVTLGVNETAEIVSLRFPNDYPDNKDIIWTIQTVEHQRILVDFHSFSTEALHDVFWAGDGIDAANDTTAFFVWSGSKTAPRLLSEENAMWMNFTSDLDIAMKGFNLTVSSRPSHEILTCSSDEFDCGHSVCINGSYECDGRPDCLDESDERDCVPPKASSMFLYDSLGTRLEAVAIVTEQTACTFLCEVRGTRPSATIEWYLNDTLRHSIYPPIGRGEGLSNTTSSWTFTPTRDDHRQEVKCVASTAILVERFPSVGVVLDVFGPPDPPVVSGSSSMTENTSANLVCQADKGYPGDWSLTWSNGRSSTAGSTTMSALSGNRFTFTSTLRFTPARTDNGHNITCASRRDLGTEVFRGYIGPLDVKFCARFVKLTCPQATSGSNVSLSCESESSNPATTLIWSSDTLNRTNFANWVISEGGYGGKVTRQNITVDALSKADDGRALKCCAVRTTRCTANICDSCTLNVKYHPEFSRSMSFPKGPVEEGGDMVLSCTVDANPQPPGFITWEKVGSTVSLPSTYSDGTSTLTLSRITREQAGPYRCRANNGVPPVVFSKPVYVIVHYGATLAKRMDAFPQANDGDNVFLVCAASGNPSPRITWTGPTGAKITNHTEEGRIIIIESPADGDDLRGYSVLSTLQIKRVVRERDDGAFTCKGNNGVGRTATWTIHLNKKEKGWGLVIGLAALGIVTLVTFVLICALLCRRQRVSVRLEKHYIDPELDYEKRYRVIEDKGEYDIGIPMHTVGSEIDEESVVANAINSRCLTELARGRLTIDGELGQGALGKVLLARASDIVARGVTTLVAVKTLKDGEGEPVREILLQELTCMKSLPSHANVVELLGCCTEEDPVYVIVEYLPKGSLKKLLTESLGQRGQPTGELLGSTITSLTARSLMGFARDVAEGMAFLSSQQCLHKDLAARNVLVGQDMTCKITDFGFARDVKRVRDYLRQCQEPLPMRWMALESILDDVYTKASDVWSFGVLLWEIVTLGARPYPAMSAETMMTKVENGYRMPRPKHTRIELYKVMSACWFKDPTARPSFQWISQTLTGLQKTACDCITLEAYQEHLYKEKVPSGPDEKV